MTDPSAPSAIGAADATGRFAWYRSLSPQGRRVFAGAFGGCGLDSYDFRVLPPALTAIAAYFHPFHRGRRACWSTGSGGSAP